MITWNAGNIDFVYRGYLFDNTAFAQFLHVTSLLAP